jgi:hypothetical protein
MSNEVTSGELFPTEEEARMEWRKRLYFKPSTLKKLAVAARMSVRTDEDMVVWIVEQFLEREDRTNGKQ